MIKPRLATSAIVLVFAVVFVVPLALPAVAEAEENDVLVVIIDGLRHDYITDEIMPNLHAFSQEGIVGTQHHVMCPTVTRVNASTIGTGTFPRTHGLMHNQLHLRGKSDDNFNTGSGDALDRVYELTDGHVLTTPTLGELLDEHGMAMVSIGSGSHGSTALLNITTAGWGVINARGYIRPEATRERVIEAVGEPPDRQRPNVGQDRWAVDVYRDLVLPADNRPRLTMMWLNEPDGTQHSTGVGTPDVLEALEHVDENFGRILAALDEHDRRDRTNILIATDHGFSTHTGGFNVGAVLREHDLADRVHIAAGSQLYVDDSDPDLIAEAVAALQAAEGVGPIFTRPAVPGEAAGHVPGTLSLDLVRWNHDRAADILATPDWTSEVNEHGYAGTTTAGGTAGHSTLSPHEMQVHLIAVGPDIRSGGLRSDTPTGNIDLAPTAAHLLGLTPPEHIEGRVLQELLVDGPEPEQVNVARTSYKVEAATGDGPLYRLGLDIAWVHGVPYFSRAVVERP